MGNYTSYGQTASRQEQPFGAPVLNMDWLEETASPQTSNVTFIKLTPRPTTLAAVADKTRWPNLPAFFPFVMC